MKPDTIKVIFLGILVSFLTTSVVLFLFFSLLGEDKKSVLSYEENIIKVVEGSESAIVSIIVSKDIPVLEKYYERIDFFRGPLGSFQIDIPRYREGERIEREIGGGSGFLISSDGLVITNRHNIFDSDASYAVLTNDGEIHKAQIVDIDPFMDIAILKIEGDNFSYLKFGDSDNLRLGQSVIAVGNVLGKFQNSVSLGVVSGLARSITATGPDGRSEFLENVIQTDAAINFGNSGGPLLNLNGEVIGINVATSLLAENVGFALPVNDIRVSVDSVKEYGQILRAFLGVRYLPLDKNIAGEMNLPIDYGILLQGSGGVSAIYKDSSAEKAGLKDGDIIAEVDGINLSENISFSSIMRRKMVGEQINLKVLRDGDFVNIVATLEKAP